MVSNNPEPETIRDDARACLAPLGAVDGQDSTGALLRGQSLGRYIVIAELGRGGMGVVYSAYDPDLDRRVAVKLIRPSGETASIREVAQAGLLREAQAMAKLNHPNSVTVYDFGRIEDAVFIAMEYVDGETLRRYLADSQRERLLDHREILRLFISAGRGLAAAHEAGIAHRDFKPENVIVARDGRVLVLDFGLAGHADPCVTEDFEVASGTTRESLIGTPAYMSPEQLSGCRADASSDQFSFCVALFEALYGERPFSGNTLEKLKSSVLGARIEQVNPRHVHVPRWLRQQLERGLARDPADRFASMNELLLVLEHGPQQRQRKITTAVVATLLAAAGAVAFMKSDDVDPCASSSDLITQAWTPDKREAVVAALSNPTVAYTSETAQRVATTLDAYAAAWIQQREAACYANEVERTLGDELYSRQRMCLDQSAYSFTSQVEGLIHGGPGLAVQAPSIVAKLPATQRCASQAYLRAELQPPSDPDLARAVAELRNDLARVVDRTHHDKSEALLDEASALTERARALDYPPIVGQALVHETWVARSTGAESDQLFELAFEALRRTIQAGDDRYTLNALLNLADHDLSQDDLAAADRQLQLAEAVLDRLNRPTTLEINWLQHRLKQAVALQDHETMVALGERILELRRRNGTDESIYAVIDIIRLAEAYDHVGRINDAEEATHRGLASATHYFGSTHPYTSSLLTVLARIQTKQGRFDEALGSARRSYEQLTLAGSYPNPRSLALHAAALALSGLDRKDEVRKQLYESYRVANEGLGPENTTTAIGAVNIGCFEVEHGDPVAAEPFLESGLDTLLRQLGNEHSGVRTTRVCLGDLRRTQGRFDEALSLYELAVDFESTNDAATVGGLTGQGLVALEQRRVEDAVALLRQAAERSVPTGSESVRGDALFALARALRLAGERSRAADAATKAEEWFSKPGGNAAKLQQVRDFIADENARFAGHD